MARRGWLWVVGGGLCGGLLSACAHTAGDQVAAAVPAAPAPVAKKETPAEEQPIRPAGYPQEKRTEIDLLPQTPPDDPPRLAIPPPEPKPLPPPPPPPKDPALVAALRCYLERRPDDAIALLQDGDPNRQELLLVRLPLAARLAEGGKAGVVLDQLDTLVAPLRSRAALVIDKACFCRDGKIMFGVYDPLPEDYLFRPGEYVHVYVELRNFTSEAVALPSGQTDYVIKLRSTYEIRDAAGKPVPGGRGEIARKAPNRSHTQRRDYFDGYHFCLPEADRLPSGLYTLWVSVADLPTGRVARRSLDFHVAAGPR